MSSLNLVFFTDQHVQRLILFAVDVAMLVADRPSDRYVGAVNDPHALIHVVAVGEADGRFMELFTLRKKGHCVRIIGFWRERKTRISDDIQY